MNKKKFFQLFILIALFIPATAQNQEDYRIPPREDDHFWRNKVINRIDFRDKINIPLIQAVNTQMYLVDEEVYAKGVIEALLAGCKEGKYIAYSPDNLKQALSWEDVLALSQQQNDMGENGGFEDDWPTETYEDDEFPMDEGLDDFPGFETEMPQNNAQTDVMDASSTGINVAPYTEVMEFIEDRIFDKNRSDMVYDIQYIRLVWVDPAETLPDKNFVCFSYEDVQDVLQHTVWNNKYNDAEDRNVREIFDLRLFNSYITYVSGKGVGTLDEAEYRKNQIVDYEHHLWSF